MEEIIRSIFAFLGIIAMITVIRIDRRYPADNPIDNVVYYIISAYILLVYIGPGGARKVANKIVEKIDLSSFNISITKDDSTKK
jgi:hypothetical protein